MIKKCHAQSYQRNKHYFEFIFKDHDLGPFNAIRESYLGITLPVPVVCGQ